MHKTKEYPNCLTHNSVTRIDTVFIYTVENAPIKLLIKNWMKDIVASVGNCIILSLRMILLLKNSVMCLHR